jgi:hypothetical protein
MLLLDFSNFLRAQLLLASTGKDTIDYPAIMGGLKLMDGV